ncbi:MAG TPA: hypothetical protein VLL25_20035, partial [Acidimicrobiales bacterium]|nr:hypothetical protein [Acidimicrobiales bacterium]
MDATMTPPPVRLDGRVVVAADVERVAARLRFDVAARSAHAEAGVEFVVEGGDGCPALDLRQNVASLRLDGVQLPGDAFSPMDLGGGEGAEMRVLDRVLPVGSRHRLDLSYQLDTPAAREAQPIGWDGGVRFDFSMSDLYPGRYLEMWLPAGLCQDRFRLRLDIEVLNASVGHTIITNGVHAQLGADRWEIAYPAQFTSLSPMLVIAPSPQIDVRQRLVALAGRTQPVTLVTAGHHDAEADLVACEADIAAWLAYNAERYRPWVHGDRFAAVIWGPRRGMEYDSGTTASVSALEHEVLHSWFGRGVKPSRASDGWIDEAWTGWATSSRRSEEGRFAEVELGLDEPPVVLCPPHPWSRHTPVESYREGTRLFAGLAHLLGGA